MRLAIMSGTNRTNSASKIERGLNLYDPKSSKKLQYSDCLVSILNGQLKVEMMDDEHTSLESFDIVYLHGASNETLRYLISRYCRARGIRCINSESNHTQYINKLIQYSRFTEENIPIPDTYGGYKDALVAFCERDSVKYPVIVKAADGSNGRDNFMCRTKADLEQCSQDQLYVLQPFIANTHDYRVVVAGDQVIYAYKRARTDGSTHLNNVSAGGVRDLTVQLPKEYETIAIKASKAVEREISGIDILVSLNHKPYVLESNFNFGLPKFELIENGFYEKLHAYMETLVRNEQGMTL